MSGSMKYQTTEVFKGNHASGQSRAAWKSDNPGFGKMAEVTFSWSSFRRYLNVAIAFAEWAKKKYHIRQIKELTRPMVLAYIAERRTQGLSPRTIATEITGLRRFGLYLVLRGWHQVNMVPDDLSEPHGAKPRYSLTDEYEDQVIDEVALVDPKAAEVLRWQRAAALRIREAVTVRNDRIDFENARLETKGKGGKVRWVPINDRDLLARLDRSKRFPLLEGKATSQIRHIEKLVADACEKLGIQSAGTHGFRAGAAQRLLDEQLDSGVDERTARKNVAHVLGHNRTDVTRSYAP